MKLVLANNQSRRFVQFHEALQAEEKVYDYGSYNGLLFSFRSGQLDFLHIDTGRRAEEYSGAYLNGYARTPELAITTAITLGFKGIPYVDSELHGAPSLSKLSEYARLAAGGVRIPVTYGGTQRAVVQGIKGGKVELSTPVVLKRADADRGIDNYLLDDLDAVLEKLETRGKSSSWILQEFIPNDGFYRIVFYVDGPKLSIYRTLEREDDGDAERAHIYKPRGGINASQIAIHDLSPELLAEAEKSVKVMRREIAGVDALIDARTGESYILEVNYNPQLVTVATFSEVRQKEFLAAMKRL